MKFQIRFRVEQLLEGVVEVEAEGRNDASNRFTLGHYDDARLEAKLDLLESEDRVVEVKPIPHRDLSPASTVNSTDQE